MLRSQHEGGVSSAIESGIHVGTMGGTVLIECVDDGSLDKDLSSGNVEEKIRRHSEKATTEVGDTLGVRKEWKMVVRALRNWDDDVWKR